MSRSALLRARWAGVVLALTLPLAGCASSPALTDRAATDLQQDVLAVTTAAKSGDVTSALAALDAANAELEAAYARGDVGKERYATIRAAIAAVRAKLEGQPVPSGGTSSTPSTGGGGGSKTPSGTKSPAPTKDAPIMTPAPGTNDQQKPPASEDPAPAPSTPAPEPSESVEPEPSPTPSETPAPSETPTDGTTEGQGATGAGTQDNTLTVDSTGDPASE